MHPWMLCCSSPMGHVLCSSLPVKTCLLPHKIGQSSSMPMCSLNSQPEPHPFTVATWRPNTIALKLACDPKAETVDSILTLFIHVMQKKTLLGWPASMGEVNLPPKIVNTCLASANFFSPNLPKLILDYPLTNFPLGSLLPNNCSSAPLRVEQKGKTPRHKHSPPSLNPCAWPAIPYQLASLCSQPVYNLPVQIQANRNPPNPTQFFIQQDLLVTPSFHKSISLLFANPLASTKFGYKYKLNRNRNIQYNLCVFATQSLNKIQIYTPTKIGFGSTAAVP